MLFLSGNITAVCTSGAAEVKTELLTPSCDPGLNIGEPNCRSRWNHSMRSCLGGSRSLRARAHKHTLAWCPNYINMWVISLWVSRAMPAARLLSLCLALSLNPAISCLFLLGFRNCHHHIHLWMPRVWSARRLTGNLGQYLSLQTR